MIGRRGLLGGLGAMAVTGPVIPVRRLLGKSRAGSGPAPASQVFLGRLVIVFGPTGSVTGVFVYAVGTSPGPGNPPIASMTANLFDPYGNSVKPGVASYKPSTNAFAELIDESLKLQDTAGNNWEIASFLATGVPYLAFEFSGGTAISFMNQTGSFLPSQPAAAGTPEIWHTFGALSNGWTGTVRYQLNALGRVNLDINISSAAATAITFATMPAGYIPTPTGHIAAGATGNVGANKSPYVEIVGGTGALTMNALNAFSAAGSFVAGGSYSLN